MKNPKDPRFALQPGLSFKTLAYFQSFFFKKNVLRFPWTGNAKYFGTEAASLARNFKKPAVNQNSLDERQLVQVPASGQGCQICLHT
jgi:hypothetical protein